jgi:uncharacterized protein YkwD
MAVGALLLAVPAGGGAATTQASSLLARINTVRAQHHLRPLHLSAALTRVASAHSRYLDGIHALRHASADGTSASVRIRRVYRARLVGEAIAYGPTTAWIFKAWMGSAVHRAILLDRSFRSIGIGIVHDGGTYWVTADFGS